MKTKFKFYRIRFIFFFVVLETKFFSKLKRMYIYIYKLFLGEVYMRAYLLKIH